ncbi:MAG: carboxypeptidase regulatory-like domain-containing protein [Acidobacteriota bacterium]
MNRWTQGLAALALSLAIAGPAFAQGGGASSTGTIQGRVSDAQGAVLPGVTVTASSPAMLGQQTTVTSETGNYRFPAVPPGVYTLTYELAGFNTLKREGIQISLGFTANINVDLTLATLQETVTVTGESPVIDTSATRVVQNFKLEQLQSIPNGRDMWSLLAVTPSVQMTRIDVGGNRAGTQTGYSAYGFSGQVRVLIEGINSTEGTGGAGFYFDYSSLEEVFMGLSGQSAEMPNPGVQSQFIAKSGGNQFSGEYYADWYNNSLQTSNIPDAVIARGIRRGSNEIDRYYDTAINVGGPIKRDKIWYFGTYRTQFNAVQQPAFQFDKTFDTKLWNPVVKGTYQATQNHKIIGYYQWGQKTQPNRTPGCCGAGYSYAAPGQTNLQDSGSWVYKGEWNGTLSDKLYVEARYGDFGYYFPLLTNGTENYLWRDTGLSIMDGAERRWQLDRDRKQLTGAATYFIDSARGSHTIKVGGERLREQGWEGFEQVYGGNILASYANGVSSNVIFGIPTARSVGSLKDNDNGNLTSRSALNHDSLFANDTWAVGRVTLNFGVRYDRYHGWLPEQEQLAATVGPVSVAAATFAENHLYTWNQVAPRVGFVYDFANDGKTVLKANYGLFWHNPGVGVGSDANPNTPGKSATYAWNDLNGDRRWQPGEQGALTSASLQGTISLDPNIKAPVTHEASVWLERQLSGTMGVRAGFVYKSQDDLIATYTPNRSILNGAYSVPFSFVDIGVDGIRGTADDATRTLYGMPSSAASQFPTNQVVMNLPRAENFRTVEASINRRYSNRWSAQIGGSLTWLHDYPEGFPTNPNQPGLEDRTTWNLKASGSYDAPFGIRISPVLRHQSGVNFARTISVPANAATPFGLVMPASTIYAESADARREDNIWVFDVRAEKTVEVGARTRLRLFIDFFNITNSHASETITRTTGANFLRPSAILAPFTTRLGVRFLW